MLSLSLRVSLFQICGRETFFIQVINVWRVWLWLCPSSSVKIMQQHLKAFIRGWIYVDMISSCRRWNFKRDPCIPTGSTPIYPDHLTIRGSLNQTMVFWLSELNLLCSWLYIFFILLVLDCIKILSLKAAEHVMMWLVSVASKCQL